jgi:hypothetical protein
MESPTNVDSTAKLRTQTVFLFEEKKSRRWDFGDKFLRRSGAASREQLMVGKY